MRLQIAIEGDELIVRLWADGNYDSVLMADAALKLETLRKHLETK